MPYWGRSVNFTGELRHLARFRTPSLRNVGVRAPYMHNGRFATLEEVVDFYDRGGDFPGPHQDSLMEVITLSEQAKVDLVAYLQNDLTDPRVASESGPLFDRPIGSNNVETNHYHILSWRSAVSRSAGQVVSWSGGQGFHFTLMS